MQRLGSAEDFLEKFLGWMDGWINPKWRRKLLCFLSLDLSVLRNPPSLSFSAINQDKCIYLDNNSVAFVFFLGVLKNKNTLFNEKSGHSWRGVAPQLEYFFSSLIL